MCDFFWKRMENDQGDLIDIVRAGGSRNPDPSDLPISSSWPCPSSFPSPLQTLTHDDDYFGDPFGHLRDPLLNDLPLSTIIPPPSPATAASSSSSSGGGALKILSTEEMKRPCSIFSRMLQISPASAARTTSPLSPRAIKPNPIITADMMKPCCPIDNTGLQMISSPRTPGLKRRKGQAKKVVCIPAPTAASSRPSGEVVPSDLWAWRKYGQKPIKGSPYPRGYYRCSSSKGCSARKQVERSRTDPNMLVITYTSEHNHPWPTQRNALAGSTRAQPSKSSTISAPKSSPNNQMLVKAESKEAMSPTVKEEVGEMEGMTNLSDNHDQFDQPLIHQSYKPMIPDSNQPDDFFADLAELEPDPMSLIFSTGFMGEKSDEERDNKAMDPFNMFDWAENSMQEAKKGL